MARDCIIDFKTGCDCGFSKSDLNNAPLERLFKVGFFKHDVAVINLYEDYKLLIGGHKCNFQREAAKCKREGFYLKEIDRQSYITEIVEINHSRAVRCEKPMSGSYLRSVEQWGGQPEIRTNPVMACEKHCTKTYGLFSKEPGIWGDGKLVAYITINIYGNLVNYAQILGHGDYLKHGIMQLLHLELLEILSNNKFSQYICYYLYHTGEKGLMDWKRRAGFRPHKLMLK